ncbi:hypothetical protein LP420_33580 [Massilia sp. B-10]|nr:hypothetical protein LP420_33580 [Massilia sp. B-10]
MRAYRKFAGLYNFTLLTATTDDSKASLQSQARCGGRLLRERHAHHAPSWKRWDAEA